jgi:hypothetical protein
MTFFLDPDARLDYTFDWTDWLDTDETITDFTVTAGTGITIDGDPTEADGVVTVWLTDGTEGTNAAVTCHVVTSAGRQDDRTFRVRVQQR